AEDGIRDFHVTGVQTCALPIWSTLQIRSSTCPGERSTSSGKSISNGYGWNVPSAVSSGTESLQMRNVGSPSPEIVRHANSTSARSEERRVGKDESKDRQGVQRK